MKELVRIQDYGGRKAVSARELYEELDYDLSQWSRWYKKNITKNEFAIEGEDYTQLDMMSRTIDFALSIDFAKKLSMMARTEKGEVVRGYFIAVEKEAQMMAKQQTPKLSTIDILKLTVQSLDEQQKQLDEVKRDVREIQAAKVTSPDYFTIAGYAKLNGFQIGLQKAKLLGIKAAAHCRREKIETESIPDPRFGRVRLYPTVILRDIFTQHMFAS